MEPFALRLEAVSKSFGGLRAVDGVELAVRPGERRALIGPNGAGKTTLFNLIAGALPASTGRITLFGHDVTGMSQHRRAALGLARTFQITNLFPTLTVLDNARLAAQARTSARFAMLRPLRRYADLESRAREALAAVGLGDRADTRVRHLSHGEQRQLEIVLGLASDPKILLLDEPAAGLSSGESTEMTEFLMKLDPKLAILLIEHDMDVVFDVADEISVLHFGEVLETGAPEDIKKSRRVQEIYLGTD
jgi:branched-chain amino acid transport system ATP-binding protein